MIRIKEEFKKEIPPLSVDEFAQLEQNILAEGIREPILTWNDFIVDGHNRYEIAQKHNLKFKVEAMQFESMNKALIWMIDNQKGRRNLTEGWKFELEQRKKTILLEEGKKEKQKAGGDKKSLMSKVDKTDIKKPEERHNTRNEIATSLGWSTGKVAMADKVWQKPEVKEKVKAGEMTINQAYQEIKKEEKKAERIENITKQIDDINKGNLPELKGLFEIISVDPPWPYEQNTDKNSYDPIGRRVANPYPEMSIDNIMSINLPMSKDCIVFLWTTHKFLPSAFDILKNWNLEYKATLVWDKQKMGMGAWFRMQCEFCLVGIKGKPYFDNTKYADIIYEKRRQHSRKPDLFFSIINDITLGRKLEYFAREQRDGWEIFGNDLNKF
jgi:N6-adenosine-specific RNA methylase IME4